MIYDFTSSCRGSRPAVVWRAGLAACLTLAFATAAFAKKGGGKGGGGGGGGGQNPPPPEIGDLPVLSETSIQYSVTILDGIDNASPTAPWATASEVKVFITDINKHGVACGEIHAPAESGPRSYFAILATVSGGITALDDVFAYALLQPEFSGLYISGAWEINEAGQIACDLSGDDSGNVYVAVGDLTDGSLTLVNTVANSVYGWPDGGPAQDLNESGDVISYEGAWVGKGRKREFVSTYWLNTATGIGTWSPPIPLDGVRGYPQINTTPLQLAYAADDSTLRRWDLTLEEEIIIDDFSSLDSTYGLGLRITDDGSIVYFKSVETNAGLLGYPVRWTPEGGLQALAALQDPSAGAMTTVIDASKALAGSEAVEILLGPTVSNDFDLQIYEPDAGVGTLYPVEVLNADTSGTFSYRPTAISRPDASGHGHICGWANVSATEKGAFILTPVAAP